MTGRSARLLATSAALLAFALALSLAGCTTRVVTAPSDQDLGTVTASGTGNASATPDEAVMSFGVTKQSKSAKSALESASKTAEQISSAVQEAGVAREDIQTQNVSVYPITGTKSTDITGYQANLTVSVKVRDLDQLGAVISAATNAGASDINGPSFDVADDTRYREEATQEAVDDARKNAEAMAKAAGKSVGEVVRMTSESAISPGPLFSADAAAKSAELSVPIEPGQLEITSNVTVVFELK